MNEREKAYRTVLADLISRFDREGFRIVGVDDGGEFHRASNTDPIEVIMSVDESTLSIKKDGEVLGLFIVLGNEPHELVADYSARPSEAQTLMDQIISNHADHWELDAAEADQAPTGEPVQARYMLVIRPQNIPEMWGPYVDDAARQAAANEVGMDDEGPDTYAIDIINGEPDVSDLWPEEG